MELTFFTFACKNCRAFELGHDDDGGFDFVPLFPNRQMAELAMGDWQTPEEAIEHPPYIIEAKIMKLNV